MFITVKDVNILEEGEPYASQPARSLDSVDPIATTGEEAVIIISKQS
jgi:hypothetical protein